jgi:hypothetical protein
MLRGRCAGRSGWLSQIGCHGLVSSLLQLGADPTIRGSYRDYSRHMDGARWARLRWRLRGAWLWPAFALLMVIDAVVGHELPPQGDSQSWASAWLVAVLAMLIGVVVLSGAVGLVIRRLRTDMPRVVARDYAGTAVIVIVSAALLGAGLAHRPAINADRAALQEAVARAQAWIGDRAPPAFRSEIRDTNTYVIQAGSVYRTCVSDRSHTRTYCVVVHTRMPFAQSVSFSGYEPNSVLSTGTG